MLILEGYTVTELLRTERQNLVYRGQRDRDRSPVLIKVPRAEYPTLQDLTWLKHEYQLLQASENLGVVKPITLEKYQQGLALILEDCGGQFLDHYCQGLLQGQPMALGVFLPIAIALANSLTQLHQQHITHNNLRLAGLIYNPDTQVVKITDFGQASQLPTEMHFDRVDYPQMGLTTHLAPEQTRRLNRCVDPRTDLYALGIAFYTMLTGRLPFTHRDPLKLVPVQLTETLRDPQVWNPSLPTILSRIVLKLLAKAANARYQAASVLQQDLLNCWQQWQTQPVITDFAIAAQNTSPQLYCSQALYGRDREIDQLNQALSTANQGQATFVLITGESGIGKSTLAAELIPEILDRNGFFIQGKFDPFQRDGLYSALIQALQMLVRQLLTGTKASLNAWQDQLQAALGFNDQALIDLIPELELLMGRQNSASSASTFHLSSVQTQGHGQVLLEQLLTVFAQAEHPLTIFLDDVQWADAASLNLIQHLITNGAGRHLLLLGACPEVVVAAEHPLATFMETMEQTADASVQTMALGPLPPAATHQFIADTLQTSLANTETLAKLCQQQTQGQPFAVHQWLRSLHRDHLIAFDPAQKAWQWELDAIHNVDQPANTVDFIGSQLTKLPPRTQTSLKLAACLGDRFTLEMLATVCEQSFSATAADLWAALKAGWLVPLSDTYKMPLLWPNSSPADRLEMAVTYRFAHDRIQQAADALISNTERQRIHLQIGERLLARTSDVELPERIFGILHHFEKGAALITDAHQQEYVARLCLQAGNQAKETAAYAQATQYFIQGLDCLRGSTVQTPDVPISDTQTPEFPIPDVPPLNLATLGGQDTTLWEHHYDLVLALYQSRADCEYRCGHVETAEALLDMMLDRCQSAIDRATIQNMRLVLYDHMGRYEAALAIGAKTLQGLGIYVPIIDPKITTIFEQELTWQHQTLRDCPLGFRVTDAEITDRPVIDPSQQVGFEILHNMLRPAQSTSADLLALLALKMTNLCLEYGNCDHVALGVALWGRIVGRRFLDYERSYAFGQLAIAIQHHYPNPNLTGQVCHYFGALISPWCCPLKESIPILREGDRVGRATGDQSAHDNATHLILQRIVQGEPLDEILAELSQHLAWVGNLKSHAEKLSAEIQQLYQQVILNLQGRTRDRFSLNSVEENEGEWINPPLDSLRFDEDRWLQKWQAHSCRTGIAIYNIFKTHLLYLYGEHEQALVMAQNSAATVAAIAGTVGQAEHNFYYSLTLAACCTTASPEQQAEYLDQIAENQEVMECWAEHCPENFAHKLRLVEAEVARLSGDFQGALDAYDDAIAQAQAHDFVHIEALGNELAAKFWLTHHYTKFARLYFLEAYYGYQRWQAIAKANQLKTQYPDLVLPTPQLTPATQGKTGIEPPLITHRIEPSRDLAPLLKAMELLSDELNLEQLLRKLMQLLLEQVSATKGYILLPRDAEEKDNRLTSRPTALPTSPEMPIFMIEAAGGPQDQDITVLQGTFWAGKLPESILNYVVRTQNPVVLDQAIAHQTFGQDPYIQTIQPQSVLCLPLLHQGQVRGVVYLENTLVMSAFTRDRLDVLQLLSGQAAISLQKSHHHQALAQKVTDQATAIAVANQDIAQLQERLQSANSPLYQELNTAQKLQQIVLPQPKEFDVLGMLDIAAHQQAAAEVGGNYYDVLAVDDVVTIAIGDVTEQGLASSVVALMAQTAIRTLKESCIADPIQLLNTVNTVLCKNLSRMGVERNMTLAILHYTEGHLSIVGQHPGVLVVRANGAIETVNTMSLGMTLGLLDDITDFLAQATLELQPDDGLVLYTEGILNTKNITGECYGLERLHQVIQENWFLDAHGVQGEAIANLRKFMGRAPLQDDLTLLVLKQR